MIKRTKKIIDRLAQIRESEAEKAARRFFGTFVKDIKRNWVEGLVNPKNWPSHIKLKGKPNVSQLTNSI